MNRRSNAHRLCGPDCGYRPLYEGSQSSLSDMAGKQAGALTRVSRLRQGIILELKQSFPVEFADAERQLGKRMSDLDDEVLLAYLAGFLAMPKAQTAIRSAFQTTASPESSAVASAAELEDLRAALAQAGVNVPADTNLSGWTASVRTWASSKIPPQVATVPSEPGRAPQVNVSTARLDAPATGTLPPPPPGSRVQTPFGLPVPAPTASPAAAAGTGSAIDSLGAVFDDEDTDAGAGARIEAGPDLDSLDFGAEVPDPVTPQGEWDAPAPWDLLFADEAPNVREVEPSADVFRQGPGVLDGGWEPPAEEPDDLLVGLFDGPDGPELSVAPEELPAPAVPVEAAAHPAPVDEGTDAAADDHVDEPAAPEPTAAAQPAAPVGASLIPVAQVEHPPAVVNTRTSGPIKPLPPSGAPASTRTKPAPAKKAPARRGRKPRVSAAGPGGAGADPTSELAVAAESAGGQITDELRDKFLAVVCMPRPVFISDLVEIVGDADLVAAWEAEYRGMGAAGPLRFIAAKQRHKARGALILPFSEELRTASDGFEKSQWARCISAPNLKGAKLYELAVVLHRVIDQVVTFDIGQLVVSMRINQQRGLVGVVLVLDAETSPGSAAREEMGGVIAELAENRLGMLAVCTYAGGPRSVPDLAQSAREEIDARSIDPTFPVIAQNSWAFAADGGTSAVSVL